MKKGIVFIAALAVLAAAFGGAAEAAARTGGKAIVVYFSKTGNTQAVAETVARLTGADIFRLETAEPYPEEYRATTELAKKQLETAARPALKATPQNLADYDTVYLGHPVWWHTIPTPVMTFLDGAELAGKTVIPFCTHGGGGADDSAAAIKRLAPEATVLGDKEFRGGASEGEIAAWLDGLRK